MENIIESIAFLITVSGAFIAIIEFRSNNRIKRAEFLEKLIIEFHHSKLDIARSLLDDFIYVPKANRELSPQEQLEMAQSLDSFLRDHKEEPITTEGEIKVRASFDNLLDFFTKLSYYLKQKLIQPSELSYFKYYIIRISNKKKF